jgi:hypothetical protein
MTGRFPLQPSSNGRRLGQGREANSNAAGCDTPTLDGSGCDKKGGGRAAVSEPPTTAPTGPGISGSSAARRGIRLSTIQSRSPARDYILQRRIEYAFGVVTPDVPAKVEVRMIFAWRDRPVLLNNLVRMTKGTMVAVDFNKDRTCVGSRLALPAPIAAAGGARPVTLGS